MVVAQLAPVVQDLFTAGIAQSTQRTYRSGEKRYIHFCQRIGLGPFPATEQCLTLFAAHLFKEGLVAGTVKSYLSAVRHAQIAAGLGDPRVGEMPQLEYVVKGIRKQTANKGRGKRLPISPSIMRLLKRVWENLPDQNEAAMLWALACLCFFGFLRMGETVVPSERGYDPAVHLNYSDVCTDNTASPNWLEVKIKASKTDPFRTGVSVYLGTTGCDLCPVASMLSYMVRRGSCPGPMFMFADGRYLTRERFVDRLQVALTVAGIDATAYAGHSFRIGAATAAAAAGLSDSLIQTLGRWRSSAYTIYIRTPLTTLTSVAKTLVAAPV